MYNTRILKDSLSPAGIRLTTWELCYPRFVHAELMTHRVFSRNSASSRAIPVKKMLDRVQNSPVLPVWWGKNQSGMQAREELTGAALEAAQATWLRLRDQALEGVQLLDKIGLHKQIANRPVETWMFITVIVTATSFSNWFRLRHHQDAQPEIKWVATDMLRQYLASVPEELEEGQWHMPLLPDRPELEAEGYDLHDLKAISAGRVARVSYLTHEGLREPEKDIELGLRLGTQNPPHMCFDDQTEVLTQSGWKYWPTVTPSDLLLAVDPATYCGHFERPEQLHKYDVDEDLYHVYGQQLDQKVTVNHRMVVSARRNDGSWSSFDFEPASSLKGKPRRYLKAVTFEGHGDVSWYQQDANFMRLVGFFLGDGYARSASRIEFHLKKSRKIDYLKSLGFLVQSMTHNTYVIDLPDLGRWFCTHCYNTDGQKKMPSNYLMLNNVQALALFDGLKNSDGSVRRKTWVYCTTSQQLADELQALLHIHGKVGSFSYTPYGDGKKYIRVNVSTRTTPRVETSQEGRSRTYAEDLVHYTGTVYCATTSTGALLIRRNGHVSVSGNSPLEHVAMAMSRADWNNYVQSEMARAAHAGELFNPMRLGNFVGWKQFRKEFENEHGFDFNIEELTL